MLHVQLYLVISCFFIISYQIYLNRICGVIVGVLASSAVDRGFESRSGQTRDYKIGICCFSAKHARAKISWPGIRIMCPTLGLFQ